MQLGKFSFGTGDRFSHQGAAQLLGDSQGANRTWRRHYAGLE